MSLMTYIGECNDHIHYQLLCILVHVFMRNYHGYRLYVRVIPITKTRSLLISCRSSLTTHRSPLT